VGGDGATLVDLTLVAEEIGRSLAPVPWIDHVVAAGCWRGWCALEPDLVTASNWPPSIPQHERVRTAADPRRFDRRSDSGARR
jgi:hypothetical protein